MEEVRWRTGSARRAPLRAAGATLLRIAAVCAAFFFFGAGVVACGSEESGTPTAPPSSRPAAETPGDAGAPDDAAASGGAAADEAAAPAPAGDLSAELVARGKQVYGSNCIACHNTDPTQPGALGPALAGSSLELLQAKVLRNEYPPGYTPKRETRAMIPLPHLENELPALEAYLASAE